MDLKELKQKYQVPPTEPENQKKEKIAKRRDWLQEPSIEKPVIFENEPIEKSEKTHIINEFSISKTHRNDDGHSALNKFSIEKNISLTDRKVIEAKKEAKPASLEQVVGQQKDTLLLIFEHCQMIGSRITNPLGITYFTERLSTSQLNAHNILNELMKKQAIERVSFKNGRGGWRRLKISEPIWNELNQNKSDLNKFSISLTHRKAIVEPIETALSSSNKDLKETNTTKEVIDFEIPENLKNLGVGNKQLTDIVKSQCLSFEEVQNSVNHFAYDLSKGVAKKNINLLFGVMRKKSVYISSGYSESENKQVEQEIARITALLAQKEELKELQLKEKYQQFLENNPEWLNDLKKENQFYKTAPAGLIEKMGYEKWKENNS